MTILYFDCFNGAAGDMILGALLDAGLPFDALERALGSLAIEGCHVRAERVRRAGIQATKFRVEGSDAGSDEGANEGSDEGANGRSHRRAHEHPHEHPHEPSSEPWSEPWSEPSSEPASEPSSEPASEPASEPPHTLAAVRAAIDRSNLSDAGKTKAKALFTRLAEAEASIHGMSVDDVHLHEVGALDSIVDVVGTVFALEWFNADRIVVSPMNVGGGMVRAAHGVFPVPAPATVKLLGDAPIYSSGVRQELLTPTGALLLTGYASGYGPMPSMRIRHVGYGAGDRDIPGTPNVLRVLVGEADASADLSAEALAEVEAMRVSVIECEIDDMNPQLFGPLMERLLAAGALDVFYTPIQMKKNRPATLVTVIAKPERRADATDVLFRETTTIGLRHHETARECLARAIVTVPTPVGDVRFKVARHGDRVVNAQPEFDDLTRIAGERHLAIKDVQAIASKAWLDYHQ